MIVQRRILIAAGAVGVTVLAASALYVRPVMSTEAHLQPVIAPVAAPPRVPTWIREINQEPQGAILDLALDETSNLTYRDRTGTYPGGRAGFAAQTTSCNVGNVDIPWYQPMDPRHPFIAQNIYRVANDRFEHVGISWLKHGFFAADDFGCGNCQFESDNLLNVGCADTYGVGNNASRTWLAPRSEVDPLSGLWDPCGSHFDIGDGSDPDCERSHFSNGHGPIEHLLRADDIDLDTPNAFYVYEAFYYTQDDDFIYNNGGYRPVVFDRNGDDWNPEDAGALTFQPPVMAWGTYHAIAEPRDEGEVIVSVNVVDLGGGSYRYIYALSNINQRDQIQSFSVPVANGVTISNTGWSGPWDEEEPYDGTPWSVTVGVDSITWATDDYATNPLANSLRYSTTFTYWFDADRAPEITTATLGVFEPDPIDTLTANTVGPGGGVQTGMTLDVPALRRGSDVDLVVGGADPGETVHYLYSRKGMGRTFAPSLGIELDMRQPITYAGNAVADGSGVATLSATIPPSAPQIDLAIQAVVQRSTSLKTGIEVRSIR